MRGRSLFFAFWDVPRIRTRTRPFARPSSRNRDDASPERPCSPAVTGRLRRTPPPVPPVPVNVKAVSVIVCACAATATFIACLAINFADVMTFLPREVLMRAR